MHYRIGLVAIVMPLLVQVVKMQPIQEALEELKKDFLQLDLFNIFLDTFIGFLAVLFLLLVFKVNWFYSLLALVLFLVYFSHKEFSRNRLVDVEHEVPELNEQLRTVADNVNRSNFIIDLLKQDVLRGLKNVRLSHFLDYKYFTYKIGLLAVLSFLVVFIAYLNVGFDFSFVLYPLQNHQSILTPASSPQDIQVIYKDGNLSEVLGEVSIVALGDELLELEVKPSNSEINIDDISEAESGDFVPPQFPKEIYTSYDNAYKDQIPKQNQRIVREYFKNLAG